MDIFFLNITAGIIFIGFQSPMLQNLLKQTSLITDSVILASLGATLIAVSSIFNGIGRFFWGAISDKIGRIQTFRLILGSQILIFSLLLLTNNPWIFSTFVCYILLCYGGGFGSMPSFVSDTFGIKNMAVIYGTILTAWSTGGIVGPQIAAIIRDIYPIQAINYTFMVSMVLLSIGLVIAFFIPAKSTKT